MALGQFRICVIRFILQLTILFMLQICRYMFDQPAYYCIFGVQLGQELGQGKALGPMACCASTGLEFEARCFIFQSYSKLYQLYNLWCFSDNVSLVLCVWYGK